MKLMYWCLRLGSYAALGAAMYGIYQHMLGVFEMPGYSGESPWFTGLAIVINALTFLHTRSMAEHELKKIKKAKRKSLKRARRDLYRYREDQM